MRSPVSPELDAFVPDRIWVREYPVRYFGARFHARMTVIRLAGGRLLIHSPCAFDEELARAVASLGEVAAILAPSTFHHLHVPSCQRAFPGAKTYVCPGLENKRPELAYDGLLGDEPEPAWAGEIDQALVRGTRFMREVALFDRESRTLILVDLVEYFTDRTPGTNRMLRFWWSLLRMWDRPRPAPEYRFGWRDREAARASLEKILAWDFDRAVIAHGDLLRENAREGALEAWAGILRR